MRNSTLTAHFTNTGKFTHLEISNKHGAGDITLSVNYEPDPNRKLTQNWFTCTRRTIILHRKRRNHHLRMRPIRTAPRIGLRQYH